MDLDFRLKEIIDKHKNILIFSGAGVSVDSGISDYRSSDGYTDSVTNMDYEHSEVMSVRFFETKKPVFYRYYKLFSENMIGLQPNKNHYFVKDINLMDKLVGVITQNVDGLYDTLISSDKLCEIHGSIKYYDCVKCKNKLISDETYYSSKGILHSTCCNFVAKPHVVLYGEAMYKEDSDKYSDFLSKADCIIVMGTQLGIIPHNSAIADFDGTKVLINKEDVQLQTNRNFGWYSNYSVTNVDWDYKFIGNLSEFIKGKVK